LQELFALITVNLEIKVNFVAMDTIVQRLLLEYAFKRLNQLPCIALLGSRQIGKTTLSKQIQDQHRGESIYLDLESPEDLNKLTQPELYLNARSNQLIILDEIQRMPELFPILRSVIDKKRDNGRFILLGSASPELLSQSTETLAGRIAYIEMHPFVYPEIKQFQSFQKLWLRGGYPNMLFANDDKESFANRMDFIKNYLEVELPSLGLRNSPITMRNLLRMIAHTHGGLLNYSDFSRSMGLDINTVKRYIDFLEQSYLIRRLQPFYANVSKRLVRSPKIYYRDSGLFHALSSIESLEDLESHIQKGNSWEGFVIENIMACLKTGVETYFYRTQDGTELDLVLTKGGKPVLGCEIKYSNTPKITKGLTISSNDLGNIPILVITPSSPEDYHLSERVLVTDFHRMFQHLENHKLTFA